jgi:ferredoxin
VKIVIDRALCQGHGQCEETAPALFLVDDGGLAVAVKDAETADEIIVAREAIRRCPADAIILSD